MSLVFGGLPGGVALSTRWFQQQSSETVLIDMELDADDWYSAQASTDSALAFCMAWTMLSS
jgi:hypothetical protein